MGTVWLVHFDAYLHRGPLMHAFSKPHAPLQPSIPVGGADGRLVPVPVGGARGDAARAAGITQESYSVA
jgi:hypothetical protein